jgi:hypothetical protein
MNFLHELVVKEVRVFEPLDAIDMSCQIGGDLNHVVWVRVTERCAPLYSASAVLRSLSMLNGVAIAFLVDFARRSSFGRESWVFDHCWTIAERLTSQQLELLATHRFPQRHELPCAHGTLLSIAQHKRTSGGGQKAILVEAAGVFDLDLAAPDRD